MRCERAREAASARLDGEPLGVSAVALDDHLAGCPDCAGWTATATALTRQLRMSAATDVPDLAACVVADVVLPTRRVMRRRFRLRAALLAVGVVQLLIALAALGGDHFGMVMAEHAAHEGAAWNLAIAVAFCAAAAAPRRAAGLVPLLATFIVVLAALSVHDVAAGAVGLDRVATHLVALAGLLLLVLADRAERALPPRRGALGGADTVHGGDTARGVERRRRLRGVA